jgi:hypothetical protein
VFQWKREVRNVGIHLRVHNHDDPRRWPRLATSFRPCVISCILVMEGFSNAAVCHSAAGL